MKKHINESIIDKTAALVKLSFTSEEKERLIDSMEKIVDFAEILSSAYCDTEGLSPSEGTLREDTPLTFGSEDKLIDSAPSHENDLVVIPKIL